MLTTFLATTSSDGNLTLLASVIVAILVAAGAGFKVFTLLRDKKLNAGTLSDIINSIYKDQACIDLLKSVCTYGSFQKSNTYEEFIANVKTDAQNKVYEYLRKNATCIPDYLLKLVTIDNIEYIVDNLLEMLGYNTEKLTKMFEDYIADLVIKDSTPAVETTEAATESVTEETEPDIADTVHTADTINAEGGTIIGSAVSNGTVVISNDASNVSTVNTTVDETKVEESPVANETTDEVKDMIADTNTTTDETPVVAETVTETPEATTDNTVTTEEVVSSGNDTAPEETTEEAVKIEE